MKTIERISYKKAIEFLLPKHYSGRKPNIKWAYGWMEGENLVAVCTFGKPVSPSLCTGICGAEYSPNVYELNRLCRLETVKDQLSTFISGCLRDLKQYNVIVVSYADTAMNHNGYIYQATNFIYTGKTKRRTDKWTVGNKHPRHYKESDQGEYRKVRSSKHRYVYFAFKTKKLKKKARNSLKYNIESYPKGKNKDYNLGDFLQPDLIKINK